MIKSKEEKAEGLSGIKEVGTLWFQRFKKECEKMSPHIQFRRIKNGFYRIYWTGGGEPAYMYECYKDMPYKGYEWFEVDPRLESQKYFEEWEDKVELTRKIKNYVEGYYESIHRIKTMIYMFKNDKEYRETATKAYRTMKVK